MSTLQWREQNTSMDAEVNIVNLSTTSVLLLLLLLFTGTFLYFRCNEDSNWKMYVSTARTRINCMLVLSKSEKSNATRCASFLLSADDSCKGPRRPSDGGLFSSGQFVWELSHKYQVDVRPKVVPNCINKRWMQVWKQQAIQVDTVNTSWFDVFFFN